MNCVNCNQLLTETYNYCSNCGNKTKIHKITVKNVIKDFVNKFFSIDSKILITVLHLITQPEVVINSYLRGNRVKYVPPINYLIIGGLLGGLFSYIMINGYLGELDYSQFDIEANHDPNNPFAQDMPIVMQKMMQLMQQYYTPILFLTIPLIALLSKMVFYNRKGVNLAEHIIIYAYGYSQYLILSWLSLPLFFIFDDFLTTYQWITILSLILFNAYILKRFFGLNWKSMLIKTLLFVFIGIVFYFVIVVSLVILFFIYLFYTGQFPVVK